MRGRRLNFKGLSLLFLLWGLTLCFLFTVSVKFVAAFPPTHDYTGTAKVKFSEMGEMVGFEYPEGYEHIYIGALLEGWTVSYEIVEGSDNHAYQCYDSSNNKIEMVSYSVIVDDDARVEVEAKTKTTDGVLEITNTMRMLKKESRVFIDMVVKNLSSALVSNVRVKRICDLDVDTGGIYGWAGFDDYFELTSEGVKCYTKDPPEGRDAHSMTFYGIPVPDEFGADDWDDWYQRENSLLDPEGFPYYGDYTATLSWDLGDLSPGSSTNLVTAVYQSGVYETKTPQARVTDADGNSKTSFEDSEDVYVVGEDLEEAASVDVYIVNDTGWRGGESVRDWKKKETFTTTSTGTLGPVNIWEGSETVPGDYDIFIDVNQNGTYEYGTDAVTAAGDVGFTVEVYSISGTVTLNGSGLSGITMTLGGDSSGTTITDEDGNYSFTGLSNGTYTVTPTKDGYTFEPTSRDVTISDADVTGVDFAASVVVSTYSHSIEGGAETADYHMFSTPFWPVDGSPDVVLRDLFPYEQSKWRLFSYGGEYHEYPSVPDFSPGLAYWLITAEDVTINVEGTLVDTAENFTLSIEPEWNIVGNPFLSSISTTSLFEVNPDIAKVCWSYEAGGYVMAESLVPWKGYWIYNLEAGDLVFPASSSLSSASTARNRFLSFSLSPEEGWYLRIMAKRDDFKDTYNFIGLCKDSSTQYDSRDLFEPPLISQEQLRLYFSHKDWLENTGLYATDFRPPGKNKETFEFVVEAGKKNQSVILSWSGVKEAPSEYKLILKDLKKRRRINMRRRESYTFDSESEEGREFQIILQK